jgi:hypothetical protein
MRCIPHQYQKADVRDQTPTKCALLQAAVFQLHLKLATPSGPLTWTGIQINLTSPAKTAGFK